MSLPLRRLAVAGLCLTALALLPVPAAHAAPSLTGKVLANGASAKTTEPTKTVQAKCPAGKVVIGGGALLDAPPQVKLTSLRPVATGNLYEVTARSTYGRPEWRLFAWAFCADRPPGLAYVVADSTPVPSWSRIAVAACPAGTNLLGIGGTAATQPGRNVTLSIVVPPSDAAFVQSNEAQGGEPAGWTARAYAVCAAVEASTVWTDGPQASSTTQFATSTCPAGKLAGVGGMAYAHDSAQSGQVGIAGLYPDATLTSGTAVGMEDRDGYPGLWYLDSYAICA